MRPSEPATLRPDSEPELGASADGGGSSRRHPIRRAALVVVLVVAGWVGWSLGHALAAPGTDSTAARTAEWARDHHLGVVVGSLEKVQYWLKPPQVGGRPDARQLQELVVPTTSATATPSRIASSPTASATDVTGHRRHVSTPTVLPIPIHAPLHLQVASGGLPGEGRFRAAVTAKGQPVLQVAYLRPDRVHTSYLDGIVWIDHRAARWELHPGFEDPGHLSQWNQPDTIPPADRAGLLATFNGGFKTPESRGGFYENGHTAGALLPGAASLVIHRDGSVALGSWNSEVGMTPDVVAVRQNLKLLIDHGRIVPNLDSNLETDWGLTLGGQYAVWRSGVGITRTGDIVVVMGDALTAQTLANLLLDAGSVRGMEMDINEAWMSFMWYTPTGNPAAPTPHKLVDFQRPADRYFTDTSRDFFALHLR